ncbi:MAG: DNA primase, partial [Nitrospirae bacterium]|nr:DNA primase [Nitrospirota bacterium]
MGPRYSLVSAICCSKPLLDKKGGLPLGGGIPEGLIHQVRESQDIVEIISGYLSLKKTGQNYTGLCPFHSEKTPSFTVSPVKQLFHCFGCGAGGDVFHFLMRHDHLTFPEAIRFLARRSGIPVAEERERTGDEAEKHAAVFRCNQAAAGFYRQTLLSGKEGGHGREYLQKRGVRPETVESFQVGYAPEGWEGLLRHLLSRGFRAEDLVRAGLVAARERGTGYYDRFRGRILFPILDLQKRIVGFGGRVVDLPHPSGETEGGPKYLNSPETPVFQKGHCLFGLEKAREGIREYGWVAVAEGYMDVLTAHQAGLTNVVATLGTALTVDHVALLRRFTREVVLTFDADPAGVKAALRAWETVSGQGFRVRVLLLPTGEDPDSFIRNHGREPFLERVGAAPELIDFLLGEKIGSAPLPSIQRRVEVAEECLAVLRKVSNPIERNLYIKKVSERLEISESLLASQLEGGRGKLRAIPPVGSDKAVD